MSSPEIASPGERRASGSTSRGRRLLPLAAVFGSAALEALAREAAGLSPLAAGIYVQTPPLFVLLKHLTGCGGSGASCNALRLFLLLLAVDLGVAAALATAAAQLQPHADEDGEERLLSSLSPLDAQAASQCFSLVKEKRLLLQQRERLGALASQRFISPTLAAALFLFHPYTVAGSLALSPHHVPLLLLSLAIVTGALARRQSLSFSPQLFWQGEAQRGRSTGKKPLERQCFACVHAFTSLTHARPLGRGERAHTLSHYMRYARRLHLSVCLYSSAGVACEEEEASCSCRPGVFVFGGVARGIAFAPRIFCCGDELEFGKLVGELRVSMAFGANRPWSWRFVVFARAGTHSGRSSAAERKGVGLRQLLRKKRDVTRQCFAFSDYPAQAAAFVLMVPLTLAFAGNPLSHCQAAVASMVLFQQNPSLTEFAFLQVLLAFHWREMQQRVPFSKLVGLSLLAAALLPVAFSLWMDRGVGTANIAYALQCLHYTFSCLLVTETLRGAAQREQRYYQLQMRA
ncbi:hypothetical protein cyc_03128 [Cyclospora cayetanensis]|uniref:Uncharacterized protein n=1 Tax=Cyclospora cayetanensis TaxID=88456 RepID=A0A1D3CYW2_9EIME|nr:hypothetical protein cyc_03128 [Cyclospora cayetanensis]